MWYLIIRFTKQSAVNSQKEKSMYEKTDMKALQTVCKILNKMDEVEEKIKIIGTAKDKMVKWFIATVNALDAEEVVLDDEVVEFYNNGIIEDKKSKKKAAVEDDEPEDDTDPDDEVDDEPEDEVDDEPEDDEDEGKVLPSKNKNEKPKKPKKEKVKKAPKEKKPKKEVERSVYGSMKGSQAYEIDGMIQKGLTLKDAAAQLETTVSRIHSHIKHLQAKGIKIRQKDGIYKIATAKDIEEMEANKIKKDAAMKKNAEKKEAKAEKKEAPKKSKKSKKK